MSTVTQKALLLDKNQVLIKVPAAAALNWKIRKYGIYVQESPAVLGSDIAGEVEEVGEGVTDFKKGNRFWTKLIRQPHKVPPAVFYCPAASPWTTKNPSNISFDEPASRNTQHAQNLKVGVGVLGKLSRSSVPCQASAVQLAKLSGFTHIITTASPKNADAIASLDATAILDRNLPALELSAEIAKVTDGQSLDVVFDAVDSLAMQQAALEIVAPGGTVPSLLAPM
ncbi:unnamed protein product [Cyclocybe aegerita]|uniref:Uncharacterized protein n=1 Tax=Cyclocybe aegerita TaxID=1973307 RepID=A0A8S0VU19_CYCAE|nr:unnamed protein product [Cyclocybe aegerita]